MNEPPPDQILRALGEVPPGFDGKGRTLDRHHWLPRVTGATQPAELDQIQVSEPTSQGRSTV
jgi:hypothetical protein